MNFPQNGRAAQGEALPKLSQPFLAKWLPLAVQTIGGRQVQTFHARELHAVPEEGRDFSSWIKDRIGKHGFIHGAAYAVFTKLGETPKAGRPQKEYAVSLDMVKELAKEVR